MSFEPFLAGAVLTLGLIVAVGPQNLHLLRTGLAGRHLGATVALCVAADAVLLGLGLGGASAALLAAPAGLEAARWVAVLVLGWLAARAAHEAARTCTAEVAEAAGAPRTLARTLVQTAVVSFGNPAVWVETLLVVGVAGAALPTTERAAFGAGAFSASAAWYCTLGYGARAAAGWIDRPAVRRGLAALSASTLALAAWQLGGRGLPPVPASDTPPAGAGTSKLHASGDRFTVSGRRGGGTSRVYTLIE